VPSSVVASHNIAVVEIQMRDSSYEGWVIGGNWRNFNAGEEWKGRL